MRGLGRQSMLHIVLWKWTQPNPMTEYTAEHVNVMVSMLNRNLANTRHRIVCVTDNPDGIVGCETFPLWKDAGDLLNATKVYLPSCYRRLKLYDPATQALMGIPAGDRIMSIDLDTVIAGPLDRLVATEGRFIGWELRGTYRPKVFNGSLQMFTAGDLAHIWKEFNPATSPKQAANAGFLGSDQAWLSMNLIGTPGATGLKWPLVASYPLNVRLQNQLDPDTRIVFYHGRIKPWSDEARTETYITQRLWR
jgi:hypothetical protein